MTDNDIVKALEIGKTTCFCEDCPLYDGKVHNCTQLMSTVALDLINRKQTEIKMLKNKVEELSEILSDTIRIRYAETRAEVVKEFAERLKEMSYPFPCAIGVEHAVTIRVIDDLVKEIVMSYESQNT